jgi:hypothetical protein
MKRLASVMRIENENVAQYQWHRQSKMAAWRQLAAESNGGIMWPAARRQMAWRAAWHGIGGVKIMAAA